MGVEGCSAVGVKGCSAVGVDKTGLGSDSAAGGLDVKASLSSVKIASDCVIGEGDSGAGSGIVSGAVVCGGAIGCRGGPISCGGGPVAVCRV